MKNIFNLVYSFKELPEPPENPLDDGIIIPVEPEDKEDEK